MPKNFSSCCQICKYQDSSVFGNFVFLQPCPTINISGIVSGFDVIQFICLNDLLAWQSNTHACHQPYKVVSSIDCVRVSEQQAGRLALTHSFLPQQLLSLVERHESRRGRSLETWGPQGSAWLKNRWSGGCERRLELFTFVLVWTYYFWAYPVQFWKQLKRLKNKLLTVIKMAGRCVGNMFH